MIHADEAAMAGYLLLIRYRASLTVIKENEARPKATDHICHAPFLLCVFNLTPLARHV